MLAKVNFNLNQLISSDLFLGYFISNKNPRINYFLLGSYKNFNIFNLNYTSVLIKKTFNFLLDLLMKKSILWVVNENFSLFYRSRLMLSLLEEFEEIYFFNFKWYKGLLSNYKFVSAVKPYEFPYAILSPNLSSNFYSLNEANLVNIPSISLIDSTENPLTVFYSIPANSKSIKSIFFFYLLISKSSFYSRYFLSSSFLLNFNRKINKIYKLYFFRQYNKKKSLLSFHLKFPFWVDKVESFLFFSKKLRFPQFSLKTTTSIGILYFLNNLILAISKRLEVKVKISKSNHLTFVKSLIEFVV